MHVMIDLETMSSDMDAAIIAIGAVLFDKSKPTEAVGTESVDYFYQNVKLASSIELGLKCNASTIMWWLEQHELARRSLKEPPPIEIRQALTLLGDFIRVNNVTYVWAHANFDLAILDTAYKLAKLPMPWKYYNARDVRTIYAAAFGEAKVPGLPDNPNKHNALYDAYNQAKGVQICLNKLDHDSN